MRRQLVLHRARRVELFLQRKRVVKHINQEPIIKRPQSDQAKVVEHASKFETMQNSSRNDLTWQRSYRTVVNSTAKRGYRPDLRQTAVARVSAIHNSQRQKKDAPAPKPRGAKAKAAAALS